MTLCIPRVFHPLHQPLRHAIQLPQGHQCSLLGRHRGERDFFRSEHLKFSGLTPVKVNNINIVDDHFLKICACSEGSGNPTTHCDDEPSWVRSEPFCKPRGMCPYELISASKMISYRLLSVIVGGSTDYRKFFCFYASSGF